MIEIEKLVSHKELGLYDLGGVTMVRPTGRYVDACDLGVPEFMESRLRYCVEVKEGWFGRKRWVSANRLKPIRTRGQA